MVLYAKLLQTIVWYLLVFQTWPWSHIFRMGKVVVRSVINIRLSSTLQRISKQIIFDSQNSLHFGVPCEEYKWTTIRTLFLRKIKESTESFKMICHTPYIYRPKLSKGTSTPPPPQPTPNCHFGAVYKSPNSFPNYFGVENLGLDLQLDRSVFFRLPGTHTE